MFSNTIWVRHHVPHPPTLSHIHTHTHTHTHTTFRLSRPYIDVSLPNWKFFGNLEVQFKVHVRRQDIACGYIYIYTHTHTHITTPTHVYSYIFTHATHETRKQAPLVRKLPVVRARERVLLHCRHFAPLFCTSFRTRTRSQDSALTRPRNGRFGVRQTETSRQAPAPT
jgi:hypothetical protein